MKILWLSHFIPYPPKGGVLQRGYHLLRQTASHHQVHLLAFNQKNLIEPLFDSLEQGLAEAESHLGELCESIDFVALPCDQKPWGKHKIALKSLFTKAPYTMNWLLSDVYAKKIKALVAEHDFDFVHFDTISLAPYLDLVGNLPTSLDHHNIESHMLVRRAGKESGLIKKRYFLQEGKRLEQFEKKYCPKFDFNFTCSDVDSERLQQISPESDVYTIPNGVDIDFFKPDPQVETLPRLIFVGTLDWYPNIEAVNFIASDIWPKLKKALPEISIDIIGANPPQEILQVADKDPNFRVHGFVDDILTPLNQALAYICPIKDGGGTKLKILDALSMAKAIVADDIACEGIQVTNGQDVIFATSGDEYVAAIKSLLDDQKLRKSLQINARQLAVSSYSYESIGRQLSELFIRYSSKESSCAASQE